MIKTKTWFIRLGFNEEISEEEMKEFLESLYKTEKFKNKLGGYQLTANKENLWW